MNIVKFPPQLKELRFSASLTGVTYLKENFYKSRHQGKGTKYITTTGKLDKEGNDCTSPIYYSKQKVPHKKKSAQSPQPDGTNIVKDKNKDNKRTYKIKKSLIKHRIHNYVNAKKGTPNLYLVTVSFPPCVTDELGYQLLNTWLTRCRKRGFIKQYLWVAERQIIGTIHYHFAIPHYINIQAVNRYMMIAITTLVRQKKIDWSIQAAKRYNGIDIKKDKYTKRVVNYGTKKNQKSLAGYITKYITKNQGEFTRLAWHNSRGFGIMIIKVNCSKKELLNLDIYTYLDFTVPIINEHAIFYRWKSKPPPDLSNYLSNLNLSLLTLTNN